MASQRHLDILKQGVGTWNRWRQNKRVRRANLSKVNLGPEVILDYDDPPSTESDLSEAILLREGPGNQLSTFFSIRGDLSGANPGAGVCSYCRAPASPGT